MSTEIPPPVPREPMPVLPLDYPVPQQARPGVITAIGVISIVVAAIGLMANLLAGLYAVGITVVSVASRRVATPAPPAPSVYVSPVNPPTTKPNNELRPSSSGSVFPTGPRGVDGMTRMKIITALQANRPLNAERRERLHQLLAKSGQDIFPFANASLSVDKVRRNISDSGSIFSSADEESPVYFVIGTGKLEIHDDHAAFFPTTGQAVRVAKDVVDSDQNGAVNTISSSGSTTITSNTPFSPFASIRPAASVLTIGDAALSLGLSIYLLVIGILVLRQTQRGRGLHLIYAMLKIPLAIAMAVGWIWMVSDLSAGFTTFSRATGASGASGAATSTSPAILVSVLIAALVSMAYPIALLFVLRSRTVREYYNSVSA